MGRSYRGAGVIRWGAQDGKDGVNYLIMGWWSANIHYKLTDAGIPVVKVEDTSPDKFSVYKLTALQSTLGIFVASEWEKVKSADFIYMQDAYIENLQAELITAERIEALNIRTSNLEVKDGAKIGNFSIVDGKLTANYSYMTHLPSGAYVQVTSDIQLTSGGIIISSSYGGTMDHPQVVSWNTEVTSVGVKVGDCEIRIDGFYEFGNKIELGAGDYIHPSTHPASMITTGTFAGIVKANNNTSYTTKQVRNMILSTGSAVSSQMSNGDIWIKYE